jgi:glycosyltransferase involved in cell wall biosynthesis
MGRSAFKVLYISHSANLYGAERSLLQLLVALDKEKYSPVVVLPRQGPLQRHIEALDIPVEVVPSIRSWATRRLGVRGLVRLVVVLPIILYSVLAIRRIARRYKIQLVHSNTVAILDGALVAISLRIPHVWHIREILDDGAPHNFGIPIRSIIKIVMHLSDQVIAISRAVACPFRGMKGAEKVRVIYNPIDVDTFSGCNSQARAEYRRMLGVPDDAPLVGQIAHVIAAKGYTDFIQAIPRVLEKVPAARFVGVGGTPHADYRAILARLVEELDVGDALTLTGFREDVPQILAALDIVVLVSRYEPLGRAVIEGMAAGKPVVGTDVGGIPEIIEDGVTGLVVPPASPDKLAEAILRILDDSGLAHQMGQAGKGRVRELFDPGCHARDVEMVYQDLLYSSRYTHLLL